MAGSNSAIKMPMMAMTTSNSTNVKALLFRLLRAGSATRGKSVSLFFMVFAFEQATANPCECFAHAWNELQSRNERRITSASPSSVLRRPSQAQVANQQSASELREQPRYL